MIKGIFTDDATTLPLWEYHRGGFFAAEPYAGSPNIPTAEGLFLRSIAISPAAGGEVSFAPCAALAHTRQEGAQTVSDV